MEQALRQVRTSHRNVHAGSDTHAKSDEWAVFLDYPLDDGYAVFVVHPLDPVYIGNLSDRPVGSCVPGGFTYEKDFGSLALCWHCNGVCSLESECCTLKYGE